MKIDLTGKLAFISGSSKGIGYAIAQSLREAGARVIVHGRKRETIEPIARQLGDDVHFVYGDLADGAAAQDVVRQLEEIGKVDILVNNAGIYEHKQFMEIPDSDWNRFWETNVMSCIRMTRALLPHMLEQNWGRVVTISSESAFNIPVDMIHYGVTKTALQGLSRGVAETTRGTGVTVNTVLPGPTLTEGSADFIAEEAKAKGISQEEAEANFIRDNRSSSLIWRFARVEEVASMVTYVVSPQASATNGSALRVDGGVVNSIM